MSPADVRGAEITVLGGARSGTAASVLLAQAGARVFLSDAGALAEPTVHALEEAGIAYEMNGHTDRALEADFIVISPGIPDASPIVREAVGRPLPIYSEIEAASWFCRAPIVAVTGSNGKTTTTSLLGHVFRTAGRATHVGGNIGAPFSGFVTQTNPGDVVVLEVSSFQLDHVATFRPRVSVLLNITPDHLDRYEHRFENYARSKFRIFENQRDDDVYIYNHDDPVVRDRTDRLRKERSVRVLGISQESELDAGGFRRGNDLVLRINEEEILMRAEELTLQGRHNLYNSLAAAVAARVMEVRSDAVRESLMSFEGVPHRLELVRTLSGVRYVNDSKATNVNAVWYALESFEVPVVLIAGGRDKGNDYSSLKPLVREKVRAVIALGESAKTVLDELGPEAPHRAHAGSMDEAVRLAHAIAEPGDVVLLSPACASFDMFRDYEARGETFKDLVNAL